jgi:hypothetical protein
VRVLKYLRFTISIFMWRKFLYLYYGLFYMLWFNRRESCGMQINSTAHYEFAPFWSVIRGKNPVCHAHCVHYPLYIYIYIYIYVCVCVYVYHRTPIYFRKTISRSQCPLASNFFPLERIHFQHLSDFLNKACSNCLCDKSILIYPPLSHTPSCLSA